MTQHVLLSILLVSSIRNLDCSAPKNLLKGEDEVMSNDRIKIMKAAYDGEKQFFGSLIDSFFGQPIVEAPNESMTKSGVISSAGSGDENADIDSKTETHTAQIIRSRRNDGERPLEKIREYSESVLSSKQKRSTDPSPGKSWQFFDNWMENLFGSTTTEVPHDPISEDVTTASTVLSDDITDIIT